MFDIFAVALVFLLMSAGGLLSYYDIRYREVPLWLMGMWGIICVFWGCYFSHVFSLLSFCILLSVSLFLSMYQKIRKKELIGMADLLILPTFSIVLFPFFIPIFLINVGFLGVFIGYISKKQVPLIPIMFLSCFISMCVF